MKKIITLLLVLALAIGLGLGINIVNEEDTKEENTDLYSIEIDSSKEKSFKYPITPKSPEWKNYSPQELRNMLNISVEEAEKMDTKTLLNVVLDYQYISDIYAFNHPIKAFDVIAERFNGLKVLLEREDLKDKLIENYIAWSDTLMELDNEEIDYNMRFKQKNMESLFKYPTVFDELREEEKDNITSISKKVATKNKVSPINWRLRH